MNNAVVDFMKNTPTMEFKSCVVLPYCVSLQILKKQSSMLTGIVAKHL